MYPAVYVFFRGSLIFLHKPHDFLHCFTGESFPAALSSSAPRGDEAVIAKPKYWYIINISHVKDKLHVPEHNKFGLQTWTKADRASKSSSYILRMILDCLFLPHSSPHPRPVIKVPVWENSAFSVCCSQLLMIRVPVSQSVWEGRSLSFIRAC